MKNTRFFPTQKAAGNRFSDNRNPRLCFELSRDAGDFRFFSKILARANRGFGSAEVFKSFVVGHLGHLGDLERLRNHINRILSSRDLIFGTCLVNNSVKTRKIYIYPNFLTCLTIIKSLKYIRKQI